MRGTKYDRKKFGKLIVIKEVKPYISPSGKKIRKYLCKCDCGNETFVTRGHLTTGHTKSCGCYSVEIGRKNGKQAKHGLTYTENGKISRLYRIWSMMKTRCYNTKDAHYRNYGEKGVEVCKEWKEDFQTFYDWAILNGYSDDLTIDRINVNGNYEPTNCRWATEIQQARNRRNTIYITLDGETKPLSEWVEITGIKYVTLYNRLKSGKSPEEILKPKGYKKLWN